MKMKFSWKLKFLGLISVLFVITFSFSSHVMNFANRRNLWSSCQIFCDENTQVVRTAGKQVSTFQFQHFDRWNKQDNRTLRNEASEVKYDKNELKIRWDDVQREGWDDVQKDRTSLIRRECRRLKEADKKFPLKELLNNRFRLRNLLVDEDHHAIYCYIPKVACTQWKRIFMVLTGHVKTDDPESIGRWAAHYHSGLKPLSSYVGSQEKDILDKLYKYKKFLIVRHPLERLMSAFKDKFEGEAFDDKIFQRGYASAMMKFFRNSTQHLSSDGSGMKFEEFLFYLANHNPTTFQEHWMPYFYLCHPCAIKYDYVGKFETIERDSNQILDHIGGPKNIRFPHFKPSNTKKLLHKHIDEIPSSLVDQIKKLYSIDFRLFGYS